MKRWLVLVAAAAILGGCAKKDYQEIELDGIVTAAMSAQGEPVDVEIAPDAAGAAARPDELQVQAKLLIGGDILLSNHVLAAYDRAGGIHGILDDGYRDAIGQADLFLANQEFPFSERGAAAADKQFTFRLPPERVRIFQELGVDVVSLANNHALDFGREALTDSIATLDHAGIAHIGAGENLDQARAPVIREINGIRVGFLGATRVIPVADWAATRLGSGMLATYDPAVLLESVRALKEQCDYVIVYVHWGIERDERPQEYQRGLGKQYLDAGADLVVGSHPHVLQGIEYYNGKPIVYSLGNFLFGSSIPRTALLQVEIEAGNDGYRTQLSLIPGSSSGGYTSTLADEASVNGFYQYVQQISDGITFQGDGPIRSVNLPETQFPE